MIFAKGIWEDRGRMKDEGIQINPHGEITSTAVARVAIMSINSCVCHLAVNSCGNLGDQAQFHIAGKPYLDDSYKKSNARDALCLTEEEEVDVPKVLSPVKAANEAAKMDKIVAVARAKMADHASRVPLLPPGAPVPVLGALPQPQPPSVATDPAALDLSAPSSVLGVPDPSAAPADSAAPRAPGL
ncbi:hypothetical protein ACP70R_012841 [Stipagrostis hirtigluma subsp. patula]